MADLPEQIRLLTADRNSPEARALFMTLLKYVEKRVKTVARNTCSDVMPASELEEVMSDVMLQLVSGSLAQFRGDTLPELLAYVRTITDRRLWRVAKRRIRERDSMQEAAFEGATEPARMVPPDDRVLMVPDTPLSEKDEDYLRGLLRAGSKANYARECSLSRAAVTQRVQRIRKRIASLDSGERMAVDAWLQRTAREVLEEQAADNVTPS